MIVYAGGMLGIYKSIGIAGMMKNRPDMICVGRCEEYVDNSHGGLYVTAKTGCFLFNNSKHHPVTCADINQMCYVEDDNTVSSEYGALAGYVFDVSSEGVYLIIGIPKA